MTIPPPCLLPLHILFSVGLLFPLFLPQDTVNAFSDYLRFFYFLFQYKIPLIERFPLGGQLGVFFFPCLCRDCGLAVHHAFEIIFRRYLMEGLLRSLIHSSRIAVKNPTDYEARSNIMWIATWALNTLVAKGKSTDWMVHMLGQAVAAHTDATHGMTLAAVSMAYYRFICPFGLAKFKRFAMNVWDVEPEGKSDEQIAAEGLKKMEVYMNELDLTMNLKELGVTEEMLPGIVESTLIMDGGYKVPDRDEIREILENSL